MKSSYKFCETNINCITIPHRLIMANDLFSMKGSNLFNPFLPTPASTTLFNSKPADLFPPSSKPNIFSKQEPLPKRSSDDDT